MAEVILSALTDFGSTFDASDIIDIIDSALLLLPVEAMDGIIVERLEAHGWARAGDEAGGLTSTDQAAAAAYARLAWADILPEVDGSLAQLDGSRRQLTVLDINRLPCVCGCNKGVLR